MWMMISPAVATSIARQQTIDDVKESSRLRAQRFAPEPDGDIAPRKRRHRVRRRPRAFWTSVDLRNAAR
jgi:hypothetical protein